MYTRLSNIPDDRGLKRFFTVSAIVHVAVFAFALGWNAEPRYIQPVYNVTLVSSVPGGGPRAEKPVAKGRPEAAAAAPEPAKEKAVEKPKPKPVPKPEAKPAAKKAIEKPVEKPKQAPPAKTEAKPEPTEKKTAKALEKADSSAGLNSALAGVQDLIKKGSESGHEGAAAVGNDIAFGGGQGGKQAGALAEQIYAGQIQVAIQRNWQLPGELANHKIKVVLGLRIGADGTVRDVWVDEPSGVRMFDETALRAVRAASPLPAPPATTNGYYEIYSRFTPADATRSP